MPLTPSRSLALALCACLLIAAAGTAWAVETIDNPAEPPVRETLQLRETWRVGGDDDEDLLLGQVGMAISGPGGEVYALDSQLAQVLVLNRQGRLTRTLGRAGEGPGEFQQPTGLSLGAEDAVTVLQTFPGRLITLDRTTGQPRGQWTLGQDQPQTGGFGILLGARERGGVRAIAAGLSSFDMSSGAMRSTQYLALLGPDGQEQHRLLEQTSTQSMDQRTRDELADHFAGQRGLWDLAPDGSLYLVPHYDHYLIRVHGPQGEVRHEITREHTARLRTAEEKAEQREAMNIDVGGRQATIDWKQQDRARSIERLQVLDDGTLWVSNSHAAERWDSHGERVYDVYGADGSLLREVTVTVPEGGQGNRLVLLDDGRFLLIKGLQTLAIMVGASSTGSTSSTVAPQTGADVMLELICYEVAP